ncbi:unnamed protein product [Discosporangium mesarthrocarpum]
MPMVMCTCWQSALALQVNWQGVVSELISTLSQADMQGGQDRKARVLLELIKVLPEESQNRRVVVSDSTREAFVGQLSSSAQVVLTFLQQVAGGSMGSEVMVQETVLKCLQSWVKYVDVPPDDLCRSPLLEAAFPAMENPGLFETAVDFLVEVLRSYEVTSPTLVSIMVPKTMSLKETYLKAVTDGNEDTAMGLCRLFTEMGENYMDVIMFDQDLNQRALIELVLLCTSHPENEIATIPKYFWYRLSNALTSLEPYDLREKKVREFWPCLSELIKVLVVLMKYPEDMEQLSEAEIDDCKRHRYEVADVLNDICKVLGGVYCLGEILKQLERELAGLSQLPPDQQSSGSNWQRVEACLFAVRSVGTGIPSTEDQFLPRVFKLLPVLPSNPHIRYTASLVVGKYSEWLKHHPEYVSPMFNFLLAGFGMPGCEAAAATAIKLVCESCGEQMGEPVLALHNQLQQAKVTMKMDLKDELEIIEGLCHVLKTLPPQKAAAAINKMVEPVAADLHKLGVLAGDSRHAVQDLERLTVIARFANPAVEVGKRHPIVLVVEGLWPVLEATAARHQASDKLIEKLCRFFKHSMRTCKAEFEPLLERLINHLVNSFNSVPHSSCLYCGSICVTDFGGRGPGYAARLFRMLDDFSKMVFRSLQSLDDFTSNPDMVEEYFYLVGRFVSYCPEPLLASPLLGDSIRCGVVGLQLHHREAHRGVLTCFEEVVGLGVSSAGKDNSSVAQYKPAVEQVLGEHGPALVRGLVGCCVGELPSYSLDAGRGSVAGVIWILYQLSPVWLQEWLVASLKEVDTNIASASQKQELMESLYNTSNSSRERFREIVRKFSNICRLNQRRWNRNE